MSGAEQIFERVSIPIAYRMGFITNNYREPSFRAIEAEFGITRPEILTLIFLAARDGVAATEICTHSGHLKTNISRAVIALLRKKLIRRVPSADDQRRQLLYLTPPGRALHDRFIPALEERERRMTSCLTAVERVHLEALLRKLSEHVPSWS